MLDISNVFNDLAFPGAYKYSYNEGWGGAAAGAAAGAAIGSIIPGVGTALGAIIGGVVGKRAKEGSTSTLKADCLGESMAFIRASVIPKIQNAIETYLRALNDKLTSYEKNVSFSGAYDVDIITKKGDLDRLRIFREHLLNYKNAAEGMAAGANNSFSA